ncbi:MAG: DNA methylase [Firmicutes bacterium]|nr:DNA methylase [Bacillota bacterium]
MERNVYLCIDLKSFYASVECVERGLDPMVTNLVVADASRTEKTICLAVSPALKSMGVPGRPRLFEVNQRIHQINTQRASCRKGYPSLKPSFNIAELNRDPSLEATYLIAKPRMALYMKYSTRIYQRYLNYVAPEDIHVYSIDEVFIDLTNYLMVYGRSPRHIAGEIIRDVFRTTGITATAGIGTNLYLAKVAMDIVAKTIPPDENGVRIAQLDEMTYRRQLWDHRPLTDFWRIGRGYERKLEQHGLYTMGDIARCSIGRKEDAYNEELLYRLFGVNAELLIDHAWGWEPCTMAEIKAYRPASNSLGSGQVLQCPYSAEKARLVCREMADSLAYDLMKKGMVTDQVVLTVGYDVENLNDEKRRKRYRGPIVADHYGRQVPKHAHGTEHLAQRTASAARIVEAMLRLYDRVVDPDLLVRRITMSADHVVGEEEKQAAEETMEQMDMFTDYEDRDRRRREEEAERLREKKMQEALCHIKDKYGKNAILKGSSLEEGATAIQRNNQIGGHRA